MSDTLQVRLHAVRYRVPGGEVGDDARGSIDTALGPALTEHLSARPVTDRAGMWLIRRLDVHACVGARSTGTRAARAVATRIVGELTNTIDRGADGDTVLWFPDRASFVAQYLVDCAGGRAAGRWEYAGFVGGRGAVETSAALRDAIVQEAAVASHALGQLRAADLRAVLAALSAPDADSVLRSLDASGEAGRDPIPLVVAAVRRLIGACELGNEGRAAALAVFVDVARNGAPPRGTAARAREAAELAITIARAPNDSVEHIATAVELGDWGALVRVSGARAMEALAGIVAWPPLARTDLVRLVTDARSGRTADTPTTDATATTPLGGMFLLLPLLGEFPWAAAVAAWPDLEGTPSEALAQYLAVAGALGPARHAAAARDTVLRRALGIPDSVDAEAISSWARSVPPQAVDAFAAVWPVAAPSDDDTRAFLLGVPFALPPPFRRLVASTSHCLLRSLAWRLPGFAQASPAYLWENVFAFSATVDFEPTRFVVRTTNPPLGVVLSLTGLTRKRFRLDATGDTEWLLTHA